MTNYEKLQYLDRLRDTIYPSREELIRMMVVDSSELEVWRMQWFESNVKGRFKALRFLGGGEFGRVFLCQDELGNPCAIKITLVEDEADKKSCLAELEIQEKFRQKGITCVIPYIKGTSSIYETKHISISEYNALQFVMPVGLSFKTFIYEYLSKRNGKLTSTEACFLIYNMFSMIEQIHNYDIIHRDLKMENLMVIISSSGKTQLVLADFGTARVFNRTGLYTQKVQTTIYTPLELRNGDYSKLSPEQPKKHDVYSIAIVAYQILDGFLIKNGDVRYKILDKKPMQLSCPRNCPDERLWSILKSIIYNSNNISRIPTAKEVCKALDKILFPSSKTYQRPIQAQRKQPPTRVHDEKRQTKLYFSNQPHGKKSNPASNKPKYGNQGGSTPTVGFKPKQTNPGYGSHQQSKNKTRVAYGGNPRGFKPKKGNGGSSAVNGYNGNGGAEPDVQDIINSLLK